MFLKAEFMKQGGRIIHTMTQRSSIMTQLASGSQKRSLIPLCSEASVDSPTP